MSHKARRRRRKTRVGRGGKPQMGDMEGSAARSFGVRAPNNTEILHQGRGGEPGRGDPQSQSIECGQGPVILGHRTR